MSLLLTNYTRAHFRSNKILSEVMRTSSPLCMADLYEVMELNESPLLALMQHEKHFQFTATEGPLCSSVKMSFSSHFMRRKKSNEII